MAFRGFWTWLFGESESPGKHGKIPQRFLDGATKCGNDIEIPTKIMPITHELDLHTFHPREARPVVDSYLQEAQNMGFTEVRVVHGKGTGTLKKSIRSLLKRHPLVVSFDDAPPHRGGWGATIVYIKTNDPDLGLKPGARGAESLGGAKSPKEQEPDI